MSSNGHGGHRVNAGRKSKAEEQRLVEKLKPLEDKAHAKLKAAMNKGERWAIEMYFGYMYGKPRQRTELTGKDGGPIAYEELQDGLRDLHAPD